MITFCFYEIQLYQEQSFSIKNNAHCSELQRLWNNAILTFFKILIFLNRIYHVDDVPSGSVDGVFDYSKAIQVGGLIFVCK